MSAAAEGYKPLMETLDGNAVAGLLYEVFGEEMTTAIVTCAERVLAETMGAYSQPNQTLPELTELLKSGTGIDPLKDFAEAVRAEFGLS